MVNINSKKSAGYTLVELLAVTSIIVIVSGLIVGVLYSTLRGGSKAKVTNDVAQNGNYALSVMSNTALLAQDVVSVDGEPISDCTTPQVGKSIEFKEISGGNVTYSCMEDEATIASQSGDMEPNYLIDNQSVKVEHDSCSFSCQQTNQNPYSKPIIKISFIVTQRADAVLFENIASSAFSTSVTMRNFNPK